MNHLSSDSDYLSDSLSSSSSSSDCLHIYPYPNPPCMRTEDGETQLSPESQQLWRVPVWSSHLASLFSISNIMASSTAILAALLLFYLVQKIARAVQIRRFKRQHGCKPPKYLPQRERFVGWDLYRSQMKADREHRVLEAGRERYLKLGNTFSLSIMGMEFINTIDEENIKTILATNFKDFGIGGRLQAFGDLLGEGIFTTDGGRWEHSRGLIRPNFTRAQVSDLVTLESHIQSLISQIPRDGRAFDIQALFFKLTLDSSTEFLFGESVRSLTSHDGSEADRFGKAFDLAQGRLGRRSRMGRLVYLFKDKAFAESCTIVHNFVDEIIARALEKAHPADMEKSVDGNGLPERYTFLNELLKSTQDPKRIRDELLNILLAGRDTTASLLGNTFHVLSQRPDIWAKLKAEVEELGGHKPDYETLRNMRYLKYLLNESLRLYPQVPTNARFALRDTVLPRGGGEDGMSPVFVPKNGIVAYHTYNLHRLTSVYGPDALEFRPERWLPENNLRPGWGFLPFNGGPRICVGQNFALTEASYTIVRLCQEFETLQCREVGEGKLWRESLTLTCCKLGGVHVAMIPEA